MVNALFESLESRRLLAAVAAQPDLQIKLKTESAYVGDDRYNADGHRQSLAAPGGFRPTTYDLRINNDGPLTDSFILRASAGRRNRWRVRFYDSQEPGWAGGGNVSDAVEGRGWNTGPIAPGASKDVRFEMLPLAGARGGQSYKVLVTATSRNNGARADAVSATTTYVPTHALDIRRQNFDASGAYLMTVQNLGNVADRIRIGGPAGGKGFSARYFDAPVGGNDITRAVIRRGGWLSAVVLQPHAELPLRVEIHARRGAPRTIRITAASAGDPSAGDFANVTNRPAAVDGPAFFPIGVWSQPTGSFDKWKSRGINTLVQYESAGATIDQWTRAAVDRGLYMIRRARPNPADDVGQPYLLAWAHPDEPDIVSTRHPAPFIAAEYARWKAVNPRMPVFVNFSGGFVTHWQGNIGYPDYKPFIDSTDWISSSIYPVNGWDRPGDLDAPGLSVDRLEKWSGGKPQFAVIESSDAELRWMPRGVPGPTPGQFRAEVWDAIIRGARGIIYFPQKFKPNFSFDNTPPEIVAEMQAQHARIARLGPALLTPGDPPSLSAAVAAPLEASWRFYNGKAYFIVLNASGQTLKKQRIVLGGTGKSARATVDGESRRVSLKGGAFTDHFAPFETHVYVIG